MAGAGIRVTHDSEDCSKKRGRGGWITTPFIFGAEAGERLAAAGSHVNLITYLTGEMHQKTLKSATILNTFSSASFWSPLLGAFIADSYLGRYATILYGSLVYLAGLILITISALIPSLQPRTCEPSNSCVSPTTLQIGVVYLALSLMVVGSGGIRPCVSPFGASQFDRDDPKEKVQLRSYFNWYVFSVTAASLLASTIIVYVQDNVSWGLGYGVAAVVMALSIASFVGGSFLYRFRLPQGSAFTRMAQVLVAATRKRHLVVPVNPNLLYRGTSHNSISLELKRGELLVKAAQKDEKNINLKKSATSSNISMLTEDIHPFEGQENTQLADNKASRLTFTDHTPQFSFLDKAAIREETEQNTVVNFLGDDSRAINVKPWRLCPVWQVEELKSIVRLVPMWTTGVLSSVGAAQSSTYLIRQAGTMNREIGGLKIPPASVSVVHTITILVWLPIFDRYLIPKVIAPRTGIPGGLTFLQKIGIGYLLHAVAVSISIVVEHERRSTARTHGFIDKPLDVIPFSVFSLLPQEFVAGLASCFKLIGHAEFFYHMVPENITATASALNQSSLALGLLIASALLNAVQDATDSKDHPGWLDENLNLAHLDYFYTIVLFIQTLNLALYCIFVSKWYMKMPCVRKSLLET